MEKRDRIRYSEAFKLKVMEELRDGKFKSVKEAAIGYGIAEMSVYNWMHRYGFDHLKGSLIFVKTRTEVDEIKELRKEVLRLKARLADEVLDHEIDKLALDFMCKNAGTTPEEVKRMVAFRTRPERGGQGDGEKDLREVRSLEGCILRAAQGSCTTHDP